MAKINALFKQGLPPKEVWRQIPKAEMDAVTDEFRDEIRSGREKFGVLFDRVETILMEQDPADVTFGNIGGDDYDIDTATILSRLRSVSAPHEVETIVYEEICRSYGGPRCVNREACQSSAAKIWEAFRAFNAQIPQPF